ncbi:hypothetical protein QLQ12_27275 [Actinoplanes sp. NEAU-A12]|uniref:Novel STAND NTPase 1 domain-containing protein n=1 Tax=Actinoplanes sandaracinus TaxID=3045177 RepID=A0ABT6WRF6_9ACTN|nr:hypothetical protein [Actinoplanes sandaracinus]
MDPSGGPVQRFAAGLRELRESAGRPGYRELARRAHYSVTTLSVAAAGHQLPSLAVTLAYVEACGGDRAAWEQRWRAAAAELGDGETAGAGTEPPYRGLAAYQPDDELWFFGRERLVNELLDSLASRRVLAVFGPSGSGKSSVLRAGLLPRIARDGLSSDCGWPVALMAPGADPLTGLVRAVATSLTVPVADLVTELMRDPGALDTAVGKALAGEPDEVELLLVVDQFEESFTQCGDDVRRRAFFAALLDAAQAEDSRVRVVLGVRADFYARCAQYPELVGALRDAQTLVGPMSPAELRDALVKPAERAGLRVEGTLVSTVVAQLADRPGVLPLASHAMVQAWHRRRGHTITLAGYEAAGGLDGAIAHSADAIYSVLGPARQRTIRRVLLRLVDIGDDALVTRRRVTRTEFDDDPDVATVIDRLVTARLLTVTRDTVEISHEALVQAWPRLRGWVDDDQDGLRLHRMLTHAAADWEALGRDDSALYRGTRLARAADWWAEHPDAVTGRERDFLDRSLALQRRARTARRHRRRALLAGLLAVVVVVSGLAVTAWVQASRAQRQHDIALSRQLTAQSQNLSLTQPITARRFAAAAWLVAPTNEARDNMTALLTQQRGTLMGHTGALWGVAFSPDGKRLASTSEDQTARLWDPATGQPVGSPLTGHTGAVMSVAFSPDGKLLASTSDDATVRLWDPATGRPVGSPLTGHTGAVMSVAFSPDGKLLATTSDDATVRLWDPVTGRPVGSPLTGHTAPVWGVAFSPDGKLLATTSDDATVRLWDPATGRPVGDPLTGHAGALRDVAFSPDGKLLATTSDDATVRLWNAATGQPAGGPLTGHTESVSGVAFSPDGKLLATTSWDATVRLWDPATGRSVGGPLTGHAAPVWGVAFSPDGKLLASTSEDHTARLWDPATGQPVGDPLTGHAGALRDVAFSPDGKLLATTSDDATVRLWNAATGQPAGGPLTGHTESVSGVAFSPDGKLLATTSEDHTARLWDPATGQPVGNPLTGHTEPVSEVAFSPDGKLLATPSWDATVRLWDPVTGRPVGNPLTGHTAFVSGVAFSPDGKLLATTSHDATVRLWDPATGQPVGNPLTGHTGALRGVAFSPDGKLLATTSEDQTARLWDPATGQPVGNPLTGHTEPVSEVAFSPDGTLLATTSEDHTAREWNVAVHSNPLQALCTRFGLPTINEWPIYAPGERIPSAAASCDAR